MSPASSGAASWSERHRRQRPSRSPRFASVFSSRSSPCNCASILPHARTIARYDDWRWRGSSCHPAPPCPICKTLISRATPRTWTNASAAAGIDPIVAMGREAHHPSLEERFRKTSGSRRRNPRRRSTRWPIAQKRPKHGGVVLDVRLGRLRPVG
jgi:hypothetical protein